MQRTNLVPSTLLSTILAFGCVADPGNESDESDESSTGVADGDESDSIAGTSSGAVSDGETGLDTGSGSSSDDTTGEPPEIEVEEYGALVLAQFPTDDVDANRQAHDAVASAAQAAAEEAGDLAHKVFLGAEDPAQFFAVDRWTSLEGLEAFFADPMVLEAFGQVFAGPPETVPLMAPAGWTSWGELAPQPDTFAVLVRGTLANDDYADNLELHNAISGGAQPAAEALGDYAHLVYLEVEDPRAFVAVDLWSDADGLEQFFADEKVQAAFGELFVEPPQVTVWTTSDFHQW